jgi:hypothetical protein
MAMSVGSGLARRNAGQLQRALGNIDEMVKLGTTPAKSITTGLSLL